MDFMAIYLYFIISAFSPAAFSADFGGDWSVPQAQVNEPAPGVTQRVETSRRNAKEGKNRTIESQVKVRLETPGLSGDYTLTRKQVYSQQKLRTFYRKMQAAIRGETELSIAEQTQLAKNAKGDFKGTFLRAYIFGSAPQDPAVRLMLHFDPYLLVKRYTARVSVRNPRYEWLELASARGDSLEEAVRGARAKLSRRPPAERRPAADFIMSLWSGALAYNNPMEMSQFLAPLLAPRGERFLGAQAVEPVMDRAREALDSLESRRAQASEWETLSRGLAKSREALDSALAKALQSKKPDARLVKQAKRYVEAVKPLLELPDGPPPSPVQGLQASAFWLSKAYADFAVLQPGSKKYEEALATLPKSWADVLAQQRSEVFLRALYLLLIARESRALQELAAVAGRAPGDEAGVALLKARDELEARAGALRAPLAQSGPSAAELFFAWLADPFGSLIPAAWAAEPETSFDAMVWRQEQLGGFPWSFTEMTPMESSPELAEKAGALPEFKPRAKPGPIDKRLEGGLQCPP